MRDQLVADEIDARAGFIWWSGRKLPAGSHQFALCAAKRSISSGLRCRRTRPCVSGSSGSASAGRGPQSSMRSRRGPGNMTARIATQLRHRTQERLRSSDSALREKHGAHRAEIRRHFGRRHRAHRERRRPGQARGRRRQRGRGRRLGDGRRDQPARRLDAAGQPPARRARIRRRRRLRRAGDRRADGAGAAGARRQCALLARLADPDPHRRRARQGADRVDRHRRDRAPLRARGRSPSSPGSRGSGRAGGSPRSAAAGRTPRRWRSPPR